jgi:hypothetical protein
MYISAKHHGYPIPERCHLKGALTLPDIISKLSALETDRKTIAEASVSVPAASNAASILIARGIRSSLRCLTCLSILSLRVNVRPQNGLRHMNDWRSLTLQCVLECRTRSVWRWKAWEQPGMVQRNRRSCLRWIWSLQHLVNVCMNNTCKILTWGHSCEQKLSHIRYTG